MGACGIVAAPVRSLKCPHDGVKTNRHDIAWLAVQLAALVQ